MKALLLIHGLGIGGSETMLAQLARHLRSCGDAVEIGALGELGAVGLALREQGFDVVVHARRPGFDRTLAPRLAQRVRRDGFDVVHLHQRTALFYGLLAGLLHRTPIVYSEHGPPAAPMHRRQRWFNRALAWRIAGITAVSRDIEHELRTAEGFAGHRVTVIPNAIDVGRFSPSAPAAREAARRRLGLPLHAPVVGSVGRLEAVKNYAALLRAVALLRRRRPDVQLAIAGDGAERSALQSLASDLGMTDALHLLGAQQDIAQILPALDVFALPSRSEGIPLSILEAMAAGVPVVATAVGGIPEAARADVDALLLPASPASDEGASRFAAAIELLLSDQDLAHRLATNARARVCSEFDIDIACRRYRDVLLACGGRRSVAAGDGRGEPGGFDR